MSIGDIPFRKGFRVMNISSYAGMPAKPSMPAGVPELVMRSIGR